MRDQPSLQRDLVFVGGGHAHALVLRMLAMKPIAGLRTTLISPASHTPYSGMLPGLVAGHYSFEETHIDLARLCQWAGVRFIEAEVVAIEPQHRRLALADRPAVEYDVVSIDIGSQPELDSVPGAREHAVPVKPVAGLWQRWKALARRLDRGESGHRVAVVGGGAGSVELALAMAHARGNAAVEIALYCGGEEILQQYNTGARRAGMAALQRYGIGVHVDSRVVEVNRDTLLLENGTQATFDELFWCTGAAAAPWLASSGLACDARGFLQVDDGLQVLHQEKVFAAGDIATQVNHPRPKAGVYAVRQAPVLAHNLRAALLNTAPRQHRPQRRFLSLVSLGDQYAVADKGPLHATGKWVWHWKDRIDRKFMRQFEVLPARGDMQGQDRISDHSGAAEAQDEMICGGCGAKVGARGLAAVLADLHRAFPDSCQPPGQGDDAASIPGSGSAEVVQSLDVLRELVGDPWLMGRIAANHALSDLYACGAQPVSALAAVTLPFAGESLLQRELMQLLSGALHEFSAVNCCLRGGHSLQGPELQVGFAVNGVPMDARRGLLAKRGAGAGDVLVLTKPLGTGVLFAAHRRQLADGRDIAAAIAAMLQSNRHAAHLALAHGASACTDITGFGLLGHLLEMLGTGQRARLDVAAVPALAGAMSLLRGGQRSSMHESNDALLDRLEAKSPAATELLALLCDPQTSGGLLIAIPAERATDLRTELQQAGYTQATAVGEVVAASSVTHTPSVELVSLL